MLLGLWKQLEYGSTKGSEQTHIKNYLGGLHDISECKIGYKFPEVNLWISLLVDAAKYRDMQFIRRNGRTICEVARLDHETVMELFSRVWQREDEKSDSKKIK